METLDRSWFRWIAIGLVATILGGVSPVARPVFFIAAALCFTAGAVRYVLALPHDRYDLDSLRRIHEKEELRKLSVEEVDDYERVLCARCGTEYRAELPACPRCGALS